MANGNGNGTIVGKVTWNVAIPIGALSLLAVLAIDISKDLGHVMKIAEQHGQELLIQKADIHLLEVDVRDKTKLRYTSSDATKDLKYVYKDIAACNLALEEHKKNGH